jgi:hypothetical protein
MSNPKKIEVRKLSPSETLAIQARTKLSGYVQVVENVSDEIFERAGGKIDWKSAPGGGGK